VAIVTNAAGAGLVCADACAAAGLEVGADAVRDVRAGATAERFGAAVRAALDDPQADAVIAVFVPPLTTEAGDVAAVLRDAGERAPDTPLLSVFIAGDAAGAPAPLYRYPEDAARALGRAARYAGWRREPEGRVASPADCRPDAAAAVLASALARGEGWLTAEEVDRLLDCYGVPRLPVTATADPAAAGRAAAALGGPVSLKGVAPGLRARTEAGAVELGLHGRDAVEAAAGAMRRRLEAAGHRDVAFEVQGMAPAGVELLVGVAHDERLGPVVACGAGGAVGLLLRDAAVRLAPITDADASAMLRSLATFPLLEGRHGAPPADLAAVEDLLARVSALVDAHPEIAELDLEPVVAAPEGAFVIAARVWVRAAVAQPDVPRVR
jgi:acyl-CoA synthetase (NDP forming)